MSKNPPSLLTHSPSSRSTKSLALVNQKPTNSMTNLNRKSPSRSPQPFSKIKKSEVTINEINGMLLMIEDQFLSYAQKKNEKKSSNSNSNQVNTEPFAKKTEMSSKTLSKSKPNLISEQNAKSSRNLFSPPKVSNSSKASRRYSPKLQLEVVDNSTKVIIKQSNKSKLIFFCYLLKITLSKFKVRRLNRSFINFKLYTKFRAEAERIFKRKSALRNQALIFNYLRSVKHNATKTFIKKSSVSTFSASQLIQKKEVKSNIFESEEISTIIVRTPFPATPTAVKVSKQSESNILSKSVIKCLNSSSEEENDPINPKLEQIIKRKQKAFFYQKGFRQIGKSCGLQLPPGTKHHKNFRKQT